MHVAIHEMRNHLCIAIASIEAFLDCKLEPNGVRLASVFAALREIGVLIDDLPGSGNTAFETRAVPVDVCRLIADHVTAFEALAAQSGVRLIVDGCTTAHGAEAAFVGDPGRIAEIVTNVMMNAIHYSPPSGEVHVAFCRDRIRMRLCISDEGPGIPDAERDRIFESGYRGPLTPSMPGSGIGLALVKHFVDGHGGTIVVSDGASCGATFIIDLPIAS